MNRIGNSGLRSLKFKKILVILCVFAITFTVAGKSSAELTLKANHDHIKIDFFYHGSSVSVKGTSDQGADLVIKIASPDGNQALRKKGKMAGLLWMNVGSLEFERIPSLYFLTSTKDLENIIAGDEMIEQGIGYPALKERAEITPVENAEEKNRWFKEFVKFKESSHLYSVKSGNITITEKDGRQDFYTLFDWPYQASPGEYTVTVYAIKGNKVMEKAEAKVLVEQAGIVKGLATMAKNNGAFYGIISILAALGAGFGVGMVFRKGGGAH
jgi:uncharacterized protein (TIGR02186 family)